MFVVFFVPLNKIKQDQETEGTSTTLKIIHDFGHHSNSGMAQDPGIAIQLRV